MEKESNNKKSSSFKWLILVGSLGILAAIFALVVATLIYAHLDHLDSEAYKQCLDPTCNLEVTNKGFASRRVVGLYMGGVFSLVLLLSALAFFFVYRFMRKNNTWGEKGKCFVSVTLKVLSALCLTVWIMPYSAGGTFFGGDYCWRHLLNSLGFFFIIETICYAIELINRVKKKSILFPSSKRPIYTIFSCLAFLAFLAGASLYVMGLFDREGFFFVLVFLPFSFFISPFAIVSLVLQVYEGRGKGEAVHDSKTSSTPNC